MLQYFPAFGNVLLQTATFLHTTAPHDDEYDLGCVDFRDPISLSDYLMKKILPILRMAVRMASILLIVRETASKVVTKHRQLRRFGAAQHGMSQRNVQQYIIFQNKNICLQPLWLMLILQTRNMLIS